MVTLKLLRTANETASHVQSTTYNQWEETFDNAKEVINHFMIHSYATNSFHAYSLLMNTIVLCRIHLSMRTIAKQHVTSGLLVPYQ